MGAKTFRQTLAVAQYRDFLRRQLIPMLPGAQLAEGSVSCELDAKMLTRESEGRLLVRSDRLWPNCFRLFRRHPFDEDDLRVVKQFVRALGDTMVASELPFFTFLIENCPQEVVARSVQHVLIDDRLLPQIVAVLRTWASQTYEGARISVAIGVDPSPDSARISEVHLQRLIEQDYAKVLSNGLDTILVVSPSGHVVEHLALGVGGAGGNVPESWSTPYRYLPLAGWAKAHRVALVLNRQGEILVFAKQRLRFALRRGGWSHFGHNAMIARMGGSQKQKGLMRAVYASCLDVSFARTGGCIAVAMGKNADRLSKYVNDGDMLSLASTGKSELLQHLVGKPFEALSRPIREEIAALDGALVLSASGAVVAAGAIVRVPGGSEGGGRRAAAKALSRLGLAVKVSSDGGITAFTERGTKSAPEVAFEVCV
jgi:DNA integrity scanning protein DisA with diadenylate cyclase activity